jgi:hypothetical protein
LEFIERKEVTMSWETMSEGGNPFRTPTPTAAGGQKQTNAKPFSDDDSDPKYDNFLSLIDFSRWERILDDKSRDHYFGPPKMITCTPPISNEEWVEEDVLFDGKSVNEEVPFDEDPLAYLDKHQQHQYHKGQRREQHPHQSEVFYRENRFASHDIPRDKLTRTARYQDVSRQQHPLQSTDDYFFGSASHYADSRKRALQLEISKPSRLKDNRYRKAQSEIQWHEDNESDQNKWSAKRLVCGMKGNEVMPVDLRSSRKPSPGHHEHVRLHSCLPSFTLQVKRETSPFPKIRESERISEKSIPPLGLSRYATRLPPDITRSMESLLKEKPAKPRNSPRKEWFERPDSVKGRTVSNKSQAMQMVFFQTIGEECNH